MAPWTKTSVDVAGAGGEGARARCTEAVAGADDVALVSEQALQQISVLWALQQKHQQLTCPSSPPLPPEVAQPLTESQLL